MTKKETIAQFLKYRIIKKELNYFIIRNKTKYEKFCENYLKERSFLIKKTMQISNKIK